MYLITALATVAFLLSLAITPVVRNAFLRWKIVDQPDHLRKLHSHPVPRVGGIAIVLSYAASFLITLALPFRYSYALEEALPWIFKLCLAAGLIFLTGLVDDLIGLKPIWKLGEQIVAALLAYAAGVQIHVLRGHPLELWVSIPVTVVWIVACTNAFNLIDGMDGLAAGVGLFATVTVLIAALTHQNLQLVIVTVPLAGALFAFLRYNFNPASVFLGDCGSLLVGFLLGCYGVLWGQKSAALLGMTAPLMAVAIPLLDVGVAVVRRLLRGQPIFGADRGHIHHMLLNRGLTPRKVAVVLYAVSGIAAAFSLFQDVFVNRFGGLVIVIFCAVAWIGIQHLGYVEFGVARQIFAKGTFQRIVDGQTRLQNLENALAGAEDVDEMWNRLVASMREFGFIGARLCFHGRVLEQLPPEGRHWQVRIPLTDSQYINLVRSIDDGTSSSLVGEYVRVIETALRARLMEGLGPVTVPASRTKIWNEQSLG